MEIERRDPAPAGTRPGDRARSRTAGSATVAVVNRPGAAPPGPAPGRDDERIPHGRGRRRRAASPALAGEGARHVVRPARGPPITFDETTREAARARGRARACVK
ncbi:hypothetical protein GCM10010420_14710 [Streptomyces glaucosporus]|uniref:Uncharacterized protein n=1 Tax=Streptomyces glaucosporus TaxID=284044 RepID=A0ABN3I0G5_9ACTN